MGKPLVFTRRAELIEHLADCRRGGSGPVGFVPTMGALHEGHAKLIQQSAAENGQTVLSIFVNPKQFGPSEDLSRYPRTFAADVALAEHAGATIVFAPTVTEMYPEGFRTKVSVSGLDAVLCGAFRPGHFDGVCTVVMLLLNLVRADSAYFGMKDFQQLSILRAMARDLCHPTRLVGVPTVREEDGLAMSSRNRYLDAHGRERARAVPRALGASARAYLAGARGVKVLRGLARAALEAQGLDPQYLEMRAVDDLSALDDDAALSAPAVLALAQFIPGHPSPTRLIDNIVLADDAFHKEILGDLARRSGADT